MFKFNFYVPVPVELLVSPSMIWGYIYRNQYEQPVQKVIYSPGPKSVTHFGTLFGPGLLLTFIFEYGFYVLHPVLLPMCGIR